VIWTFADPLLEFRRVNRRDERTSEAVTLRILRMEVTFSLVLLLVTGSIAASENPLSLQAVVDEATARNPRLLASQKAFEAAQQRPPQEKALPDPTIGIMSTSMTNPIPLYVADPVANIAITFQQEIPYPGKRPLAAEAATRLALARRQDYEALKLEVIAAVKEAYFDIAYFDRAVNLLNETRVLFEEVASAAQAGYAVGRVAQADVLRAQSEISTLVARQISLGQRRRAAVARLNGLLDRPPGQAIGPAADHPVPEMKWTVAELQQQARDASPRMKAREMEVEAQRIRVHSAQRALKPDFSIGGSYGYSREYRDMWTLKFDVRVPLYKGSKQDRAIEEASMELERMRHEYEAAVREVEAEIEAMASMAQSSNDLFRLYETGLVPQAQLTYEAGMTGYKLGQVDFLTVLSSFAAILESRLNQYEEVANYQKALAALERLAAVPLLQAGDGRPGEQP